MHRLRATIKKTMQDLKKILLKSNGAAMTLISLNLDPDKSVIEKPLNIEGEKEVQRKRER